MLHALGAEDVVEVIPAVDRKLSRLVVRAERVVVEKPNRDQAERGVGEQTAGGQPPDRAGAHDERPPAGGPEPPATPLAEKHSGSACQEQRNDDRPMAN